MEIAVFIIGWYLSGLIGTALVYEFAWRRAGFDIDGGEILVGCAISVMGLFMLVLGVLFTIGYFVRLGFERSGVDLNRTIIRGRRA